MDRHALGSCAIAELRDSGVSGVRGDRTGGRRSRNKIAPAETVKDWKP